MEPYTSEEYLMQHLITVFLRSIFFSLVLSQIEVLKCFKERYQIKGHEKPFDGKVKCQANLKYSHLTQPRKANYCDTRQK